ncbi:hypothetical protein [Virgibacillus dokdonensis]|uniref:hypothetical protein n=1 Tax=Virgibacillus dokdonensis TaxID=302167 RepID=UPI001F49293C|nr:hypothetical protein [Virgibacillus dokdonensis]
MPRYPIGISLARKVISLAASSGRPSRPVGNKGNKLFFISLFIQPVSVGPESIELTVEPMGLEQRIMAL